MKQNKLSLTLSGLILGAFSVVGATTYHYANADQNTQENLVPQLPSVIAQRPTIQNITEWDTYSGRFAAVKEVDIRSRVSGYLVKIHFNDGDIVKEGDLLFTIDPRPFQAQLSIAKSTVAEREATLELARSDLSRSVELAKTRAVSQQRVDQDKARVKQAEAQLASAKSNLVSAKLDLEYTEIKAPITGRVDEHNVDVGNLIRGDDDNAIPLTNIVSLDPIYVVFDVDQNSYLKYTGIKKQAIPVSENPFQQLVQVSIQGDETKHKAEIDFVSNSIDKETGSIRLRAVLDNSTYGFTPGLFARVNLSNQSNKETLLVPQEAVSLEQTQYIVLVVNEKNIVERRQVELGPIADGKRVIRNGLNKTDRVIHEGLQRVSVGNEVTVLTENPLVDAEIKQVALAD
jgi:multidrug efflux system membrane fusion protein